MVSHPILIVILVAASLGVAMSIWDAWRGQIRTEDGLMPTTIRDKVPSLWGKMIAGNVIGTIVAFAIIAGVVIWLW